MFQLLTCYSSHSHATSFGETPETEIHPIWLIVASYLQSVDIANFSSSCRFARTLLRGHRLDNERTHVIPGILYWLYRREVSLGRNITISNKIINHNTVILDLCFALDGSLVLCSSDYTISVWNTQNWTCLGRLVGHGARVLIVIALPDGSIASGSENGRIMLWNVRDRRCIRVIVGHYSSIVALCVDANGNLISLCNNRALKVWDLSGQCIHSIVILETGKSLALLRNGLVVIGLNDGSMQFLNTSTGTIQGIMLADGRLDRTLSVKVICPLAAGGMASGHLDGAIRIWGRSDNRTDAAEAPFIHIGTIETPSKDSISSLLELPDGIHLVSCSLTSRLIRVWNIASNICVRTINVHPADTMLVCIKLLPSCHSVISVGSDRTICITALDSIHSLRADDE